MYKKIISKIKFIDLNKNLGLESFAVEKEQSNKNFSGLYENIKKSSVSLMAREDLKDSKGSPNSLMVLFDKEREDSSGVDRVFKKSLFLLITFLISFLWLVIVSLNLFSFSILVSFLSIVTFVAISNLFYVLVADRSYVLLSILGQAVIIILTSSFLGLGFSAVTLVVTFLISLFTFIAYTELEKAQLSSRLFSISQITLESSRVLFTAVILLLSLGAFNSIIHEGWVGDKNYGSTKFVDRIFLQNTSLMNKYIVGDNKTLSVNRYLMSGKLYQDVATEKIVYEVAGKTGSTIKQATLATFLEFNYKNPDVLSEKDLDEITSGQCNGKADSEDCKKIISSEKNNRLEEFRKSSYPGLKLELDTPLTLTNFSEVSRQYYLNRISDFENPKIADDSIIPQNLVLIPLNQLIPAVVAIAIFIVLFIFKFVLGWFTLMLSWVFWKILVLAGFVHVEVETVEAEIVSI